MTAFRQTSTPGAVLTQSLRQYGFSTSGAGLTASLRKGSACSVVPEHSYGVAGAVSRFCLLSIAYPWPTKHFPRAPHTFDVIICHSMLADTTTISSDAMLSIFRDFVKSAAAAMLAIMIEAGLSNGPSCMKYQLKGYASIA